MKCLGHPQLYNHAYCYWHQCTVQCSILSTRNQPLGPAGSVALAVGGTSVALGINSRKINPQLFLVDGQWYACTSFVYIVHKDWHMHL